jgi:hypothetical protein
MGAVHRDPQDASGLSYSRCDRARMILSVSLPPLPWENPIPASLQLLDQPHVLLLEVEQFWCDLAGSVQRKRNCGRINGYKWSYATVPPHIMAKHIPRLAAVRLDWRTFTARGESVVVFHYVQIVGAPEKITIGVGVLASSTFAIARLRLIGDQIILDNLDRIRKHR